MYFFCILRLNTLAIYESILRFVLNERAYNVLIIVDVHICVTCTCSSANKYQRNPLIHVHHVYRQLILYMSFGEIHGTRVSLMLIW